MAIGNPSTLLTINTPVAPASLGILYFDVKGTNAAVDQGDFAAHTGKGVSRVVAMAGSQPLAGVA